MRVNTKLSITRRNILDSATLHLGYLLRIKQKVKTMALIKCKECQHQVSNKANICPSCGVKISKNLSFIQVVSGLSFGILVIYFYISNIQKEKTTIEEPITQTTPLKQTTISEQPIQPETPALKTQQSKPEPTTETDKNKTWTGDWGNGIIATISTQPCGNIELTNQDYDYLMTVTIPIARLKSPDDAWQVLGDRAVTITGCWSKRDGRMIHAKLTRKKGNKAWEQDFKLDDGNWIINNPPISSLNANAASQAVNDMIQQNNLILSTNSNQTEICGNHEFQIAKIHENQLVCGAHRDDLGEEQIKLSRGLQVEFECDTVMTPELVAAAVTRARIFVKNATMETSTAQYCGEVLTKAKKYNDITDNGGGFSSLPKAK